MLKKFIKQQRRNRCMENVGWHEFSTSELKHMGMFGRKDFPKGLIKTMKAMKLVKV